VTVLTSLKSDSMPPGFETPFLVDRVAQRLLAMSLAAGAAGIVCSAVDLPGVRHLHTASFFAVTPGIRPAGGPPNDQKRVSTVQEAVAAGAGMLVIGRAITGAAAPRAALEAVRRERDEALAAAGA
jgi:orotidine-5'-phosphate decarboxylase